MSKRSFYLLALLVLLAPVALAQPFSLSATSDAHPGTPDFASDRRETRCGTVQIDLDIGPHMTLPQRLTPEDPPPRSDRDGPDRRIVFPRCAV